MTFVPSATLPVVTTDLLEGPRHSHLTRLRFKPVCVVAPRTVGQVAIHTPACNQSLFNMSKFINAHQVCCPMHTAATPRASFCRVDKNDFSRNFIAVLCYME
jgi:hypothetical protein